MCIISFLLLALIWWSFTVTLLIRWAVIYETEVNWHLPPWQVPQGRWEVQPICFLTDFVCCTFNIIFTCCCYDCLNFLLPVLIATIQLTAGDSRAAKSLLNCATKFKSAQPCSSPSLRIWGVDWSGFHLLWSVICVCLFNSNQDRLRKDRKEI